MTTIVKIKLEYDAGFNAAVKVMQKSPEGIIQTELHLLEPQVEQSFTIWDGKTLEVIELGVNYKKD